MINWEEHKIKPVECVYMPRDTYRGRALLPGHKDLIGQRIKVIALWLMDEDDPYPGEWALCAADTRDPLFKVFGRSWIASGDVMIKPQ